ncbi:hypothetical protein ACFXGA_09500 [Actinosynnema sp. NPDC059335]|uniref:hypothetical protein n=1 Tax=Actinosynnema sp. NPDC059335 TaxID=3346804 RepID=UPI00366E6278
MNGGLASALRRLKSGYRAPYEVAGAEPPERLTAALVRNLADGVGGRVAYAAPAGRDGAVVESWPPGVAGVDDAIGVAQVRGGGSLFVVAPTRWDDEARAMLHDTAVWLGVAVRLARLRVDRDAADLRARGLRAESDAVRARLARVRDLERHRLVGAITTTTLRDLAGVRTLLRAVNEEGAGLQAAQEKLDELIDDFRAVVRGVFPAMLPDRGPRAALEELAATLPRRVGFAGDLGPRAGWQVESGFYHAVAAALNTVAGEDDPRPVTVTFERDDALRARVTAAGPLTVEELLAALGHDVERVAVLGGGMTCDVVDGTAVVAVRLAERVEPVVVAAAEPAGHSPVHRQVLDLVRQGQAATDGLPERAGWDAVAERLAAPRQDPVVAARQAVAEMTGLVRALPGDHRLRWAVERVGVDAHEFVELDLLDDLERGDLLRGVASPAARLLGAHGADPRSRLGLPASATAAEVVSRAGDEVTRWRAHAEHPATSGRDRVACEVLVRTAEGLLAP